MPFARGPIWFELNESLPKKYLRWLFHFSSKLMKVIEAQIIPLMER